MKIPHFIEEDAIKLAAPTIAEMIRDGCVTIGMSGLVADDKLPESLRGHYDAQAVSEWAYGVAGTLVGVIMDKLTFPVAKAAILAEMAKQGPIIPVKEANPV